eukprot:TRINITY_DN471_c0_g1_i5.p1 TRINITY_DN471_c0_g1~~TRINITY_DN471_c0_g1_i5.p1  ORF type:complete len:445 (+),score=35.08 TRINITY_DN471_c0_g1_i5:77-1411(+)
MTIVLAIPIFWIILLLLFAGCTGLACNVTSECDETSVCEVAMSAHSGLCVSKRLFSPFTVYDGLCTAVDVVAPAASAGSGLGGGGILVPLYTVLLRSARVAIPLSKASIFGASCANVIFNARRRHPFQNKPLIDWAVVLALEPATLAGTVLGVLLNRIFPDWLVTILLFILLSYLAYKAFVKGRDLYRKENRSPSESDQLVETLMSSGPDEPHDKSTVQRFLRTQAQVPWRYIVALVGLWCIVVVLALLKGGDGISLIGVQCGTATFWVLVILAWPIMFLALLIIGRHLVSVHREKQEAGFQYQAGDVVWSLRGCLIYTLGCLIAGITAGMMGIGGGMLKIPIMLAMGMLPQVVQATAGVMIMFTSSATTVQFLAVGALRYDYALWLFALGLIGGLCGQLFLAFLLNKYKKTSLIIIILGITIACSSVLVLALGTCDDTLIFDN